MPTFGGVLDYCTNRYEEHHEDNACVCENNIWPFNPTRTKEWWFLVLGEHHMREEYDLFASDHMLRTKLCENRSALRRK